MRMHTAITNARMLPFCAETELQMPVCYVFCAGTKLVQPCITNTRMLPFCADTELQMPVCYIFYAGTNLITSLMFGSKEPNNKVEWHCPLFWTRYTPALCGAIQVLVTLRWSLFTNTVSKRTHRSYKAKVQCPIFKNYSTSWVCNVSCNMNLQFIASLITVLRHGPFDILGGGGLGIFFRAKNFFSDNFGARLFFSPALRAGLFFFLTKSYNIHV